MKSLVPFVAVSMLLMGCQTVATSTPVTTQQNQNKYELISSHYNIDLDTRFIPQHTGLKANVGVPMHMQKRPGYKRRPNHTVLTGMLDGEVVHRFASESNKTLIINEEYHKRRSSFTTRSEFRTQDNTIRHNASYNVKYTFYVPKEIEFAGNRHLYIGQFKNSQQGIIAWGITKVPSLSARRKANYGDHEFSRQYQTSSLSKKTVKPGDLVFSYHDVMNAAGERERLNIHLASKKDWQGKWHTVEYDFNMSENGHLLLKFNNQVIINCNPCDTLPNTKEFKEDSDNNFASVNFHIGAYQWLYQENVYNNQKHTDAVVYMKDIKIKKN